MKGVNSVQLKGTLVIICWKIQIFKSAYVAKDDKIRWRSVERKWQAKFYAQDGDNSYGKFAHIVEILIT